MSKIGISGFNRTSKILLRTLIEKEAKLVAINAPDMTMNQIVQFIKYDSNYGQYDGEIQSLGDKLIVSEKVISVFSEKSPGKIPWKSLKIELVVECSELQDSKEASEHITPSGTVEHVIICNPSQSLSDFESLPLLLMGINEDTFRPSMKVINGGTSIGHCISTLLSVINFNFEVSEFDITTIQAATDNNIVDGVTDNINVDDQNNWRLGRADNNIIPFKNSATMKEINKIVPDYVGRLSSSSFLVPTFPISVLDVQIKLHKEADYQEICQKIRKLAQAGPQRRVIGYTEDPVVSGDMVGSTPSCVVDRDAGQQITGDTIKIVAWYDHVTGYCNRIAELVLYLEEQL